MGAEKEDTTQKTPQKTTPKTKNRDLELIIANPEISQKEIAETLGISIDGVKYHIKNLRKDGKIERIGGDKGGYWKVND